jgi:hypothetical protein
VTGLPAGRSFPALAEIFSPLPHTSTASGAHKMETDFVSVCNGYSWVALSLQMMTEAESAAETSCFCDRNVTMDNVRHGLYVCSLRVAADAPSWCSRIKRSVFWSDFVNFLCLVGSGVTVWASHTVCVREWLCELRIHILSVFWSEFLNFAYLVWSGVTLWVSHA